MSTDRIMFTSKHVRPLPTALLTPVLLAGGLFLFTACDSGGVLTDNSGSEETTLISGTVTDGSGSGSNASTLHKRLSKASVGNATVSAIRLKDDGSAVKLDATTKTESDGSFELEVQRQTEGATIVVKAEKSESDFSSGVGVQITDVASTTAQPMTPETTAEAQVAKTLNAQAGGAERASEALADAAALVDDEVASAILSGDTAPSTIASLAQSMDEAREGYASSAEESIDEDAVAQAQQDAYASLQDALATASDSTDRAEALGAFEEAMAASYEEGGASAQLQAEIQQAGTQIALEVVETSLLPTAADQGLQRRAAALRFIATGTSIESTIADKGTGSNLKSDLKSAGETLVETVRTASSASEIQAATSTYRKTVREAVESEFNMSGTDVLKGFADLQTALDTLSGALTPALSTNGALQVNEGAVSNAFQQFHQNGVQAVKGAYTDRGVQPGPARGAAQVVVKLGGGVSSSTITSPPPPPPPLP